MDQTAKATWYPNLNGLGLPQALNNGMRQSYTLIYSLRDALQQQISNLQSKIDTLRGETQSQQGARSIASASVSIIGTRGTLSTTYVMMGYSLQLTPQYSTRAVVTIKGQMGNTKNIAETDVCLVWGTGPPPVLGDPLMGTTAGQAARFIAQTAGGFTPFSITALLTGMTIGTTYWIDAAAQVNTGQSILSEVDLVGFTLLDPWGA